MDPNKNDATKIREEKRQARTLENMEIKLSEQMEMMKQLIQPRLSYPLMNYAFISERLYRRNP